MIQSEPTPADIQAQTQPSAILASSGQGPAASRAGGKTPIPDLLPEVSQPSFSGVEGITVTPDTAEFYRRMARQYAERARREGRSPQRGNLIVDGAMALVDAVSTTYFKTFLTYRAAFLHVLSEDGSPEAMAARDRLASTSSADASRISTSVRRRKSMPQNDLEAIIEAAMSSRSEYARLLAGWLLAGKLTGLRPTEWTSARWVDYDHDTGIGPLLVVKNHKTTNGRSTGPSRTLDLSQLDDGPLKIIQGFAAAISAISSQPEDPDAFDRAYEGVTRLLRRINAQLWPRRRYAFTLYSARHAFAANAKAVYPPNKVAALMGQNSEKTASEHYGKRQFADRPSAGERLVVPSPIPEEVEIVDAAEAARTARRGRARNATHPSNPSKTKPAQEI